MKVIQKSHQIRYYRFYGKYYELNLQRVQQIKVSPSDATCLQANCRFSQVELPNIYKRVGLVQRKHHHLIKL
jgi:uncharacterized lipoprotein YmbA